MYTFFNPLDLFFEGTSYWFNRPIKDMMPFKYKVKENGNGLLILNTLGVSPDDILIEVKPFENCQNTVILSISGKTKRDEKEYSVNIDFQVTKSIQDIEWISKDGVTELTIIYEKPTLPKVSISRK